MQSKKISDLRVVATSLIVSVSDVVLNLLVAIFTGSTVMLSQSLQGLSDLITGGILYFGVKRSQRKSDDRFQFGYGREIFFWVLVAGIIMFIGTGVVSFLLGLRQFVHPSEIENVWVAFVMLLFGISTNGYAFYLSVKRIAEQKRGKSWLLHFIRSSIIETKATLIVDFLGTIAAVFGLFSLGLFVFTGSERFDGFGSMLIGIAMMVGAGLLMKDVRDLIVGKSVDSSISEQIIEAAQQIDGVKTVLDLRTMYMGSARLLVLIEVHIDDERTTDEIEKITDSVKANIKRLIPLAKRVQVEIETPDDEIKS